MKNLTYPTILMVAAALSGCSMNAKTQNHSLESVHQPVVSNQIYALDVATGGSGLAAGEETRLAQWLDSMNVSHGDRIAVEDMGTWGSNSIRQDVARIVGRYGLLLSEAVPVTSGAIPAGSARVTLSRARAYVPGCPDWSTKYSVNSSNATSSNYGCATNSNLAGMVADPNDLVRGARTGTSDAGSATKAIKTYRDAKPTGEKGLSNNTTSGGN